MRYEITGLGCGVLLPLLSILLLGSLGDLPSIDLLEKACFFIVYFPAALIVDHDAIANLLAVAVPVWGAIGYIAGWFVNVYLKQKATNINRNKESSRSRSTQDERDKNSNSDTRRS